MLVVTRLVEVRAGRIWHIGASAFVALLVGSAVWGWVLCWLLERLTGPAVGWAWLSRRTLVLVAIAPIAVASVFLLLRHAGARETDAIRLAVVAGAALLAGGVARIWFGSRRIVSQLLIAVAVAGWGYYDAMTVLYQPFRDIRLYLAAGATWVSGSPVYQRAPLVVLPVDPSRLPFVYPPFLLPIFGALSKLPEQAAIVIWEVAAIGAVIAGLKLLGIRSRWIPILIMWPPIAVGLSVGNSASFAFLGLAAGWRWGAALVLAGVFKAQAAIPSIWLVRERRWRALLLGCAGLAGLVLVTLPLTGIAIYLEWLRGLAAFEQTVREFRPLEGLALQRYLPQGLAIAVAVGATVGALLATGRMGLARFGIVAIISSPTVYIHGLSLMLPGVLWLDTTSLWLVLGLTPLGFGAWIAVAFTAVALVFGLTRSASASSLPAAEQTDGGAMHPLGSTLEPWP